MSKWAWVGNWFTGLEGVKHTADIGASTNYPITWTHDQLCTFEWGAYTIQWHIAGSVTLTFTNPLTGLNEASTATFDFTFPFTNSLSFLGTKWNILEPTDYDTPGFSNSAFGVLAPNQTTLAFITTFGTVNANVGIQLNVDELYQNVDAEDQYTKEVVIAVGFGGGTGVSLLYASTVPAPTLAVTYPFLPLAQPAGTATLFHSSAPMLKGMDPSFPTDNIFFDTNELTVSQYFDPPNDI